MSDTNDPDTNPLKLNIPLLNNSTFYHQQDYHEMNLYTEEDQYPQASLETDNLGSAWERHYI